MASRVPFLGLNQAKATAHHGDTENDGGRMEGFCEFWVRAGGVKS